MFYRSTSLYFLSVLIVIAFLAAVPAAAQAAPVNQHVKRYHTVWEAVRDRYLYPERLGIWNIWEHWFDGKIKSADEADIAIESMLSSLSDDFSYLAHKAAEDPAKGKTVTFKKLSDEIGYLRIHHFHSRSIFKETRASLRLLNNSRALIVDLRDNPGGKVDIACRMVAFFAGNGTIATLNGRSGDEREVEQWILQDNALVLKTNDTVQSSSREMPAGNKPLFILVNGKTRSAAELFAGALRDLADASIVGSKTYGKGVAQELLDLGNGTILKLVTASIHLPSGECIHGLGLYPDYPVSTESNEEALSTAARLAVKRAALVANSRRIYL